jgi:CubicO group peptidase (beta-lactamase class C family)
MYENDNWVEYILNKPVAAEPGSSFNYNSGLSIVLGEIVSRQVNQTIGQFSISNLFSKIEVKNVSWYTAGDGTFQTGGGLSLHPRDMLKFGLLFLNNGRWKGEQLVSQSWVELSTRHHGPNAEYGYHWWLTQFEQNGNLFNAFYAWGNGGQFVIIIRELSIVVVLTGDSYDNATESREHAWDLMERLLTAYVK